MITIKLRSTKKMTKQEKLIIWYTQRLEKMKAAYAGDWRKDEYIAAAEKDLEEVKTGRSW